MKKKESAKNQPKRRVFVKETQDYLTAFQIAKEWPDHFTKYGFRLMKKELKEETVYGAFVEGKMIGFVCYREVNENVIDAIWIAVKRKWKRKGIGTKLIINSLEKLSLQYKFCIVKTIAETFPDKDYEKTRNFYRKIGFYPIDIIKPYPDWGNYPCQVFVKRL